MFDINDAVERIHRGFGGRCFLGKRRATRHAGGAGSSNAFPAGGRAGCGTAQGIKTSDCKLDVVGHDGFC